MGSLERIVFPHVIEQGLIIHGFRTDAYWMDVGTPERYLQLHRDLLSGRVPSWLPTGISERPSVGDNSSVKGGVELGRGAIIGSGCKLNQGARIQGASIMGDECVVGEGSKVVDTLLRKAN